ncbi:hypothetical protein EVAR_28159_1 [Eumeta japonica]|uniref:Uncharacterized protein n=1 Tax=Eumeta variegata TaxID=151549 RepID=A0A4C1VCE0_EUMVA|nr:hypothetical protein EVAR_28159_1 [Eumeta japonica]
MAFDLRYPGIGVRRHAPHQTRARGRRPPPAARSTSDRPTMTRVRALDFNTLVGHCHLEPEDTEFGRNDRQIE